MNKLLTDYWRDWRPDIYRWIAAIAIFALFAWIMVDYHDYFDRARMTRWPVRLKSDEPRPQSKTDDQRVSAML